MGCSSVFSKIFVESQFDAYAACMLHDMCYDTWGRLREDCDEEFKHNLLQICGKHSLWCQSVAELAYISVKNFGKLYHKNVHKCPSNCTCRA